ncbi:aldo/keto reductase [Nocardioides euryhalodurans]|uniref:Aldo/keto reductase n=1 Tax=Nocardioides euryhalodurans TaxID=2518370 RepID=A0A4P7GH15_9ACTN|nr:aldo/keto reductase [Nocardioides euryhalodurans]QBR91135.1 aldo/keto reductase [Nocardioides euryhalodurans]
MLQRALGHTGLSVSRLGLGTAMWGTQVDEHEARDLLGTYVDAGGTLVDTAVMYGAGASEELLGRLMGEVGREQLVVASKGGFRAGPDGPVRDTSRRTLLQNLDTSLERLRTDHVDLWQVHVWSDAAPVEETMAALDQAVTSGRARYVGVCNYAGWQLAQAATWQRAIPGRVPLASTQEEYSLLNRDLEREVLPAARSTGLGVLPYSPLGGGVLTGKYRTGTPAHSRGAGRLSASVDRYLDDHGRAVVEGVARAADGLGWTPLQVALVWVRDRPGVTAPIVGARTATQLKDVLGVEGLTLPPEIVAALDDVSGD